MKKKTGTEGTATESVHPQEEGDFQAPVGLPPIKHQDIEISFDESGSFEVPNAADIGPAVPPEAEPPTVLVEDTVEYQKVLQERVILADQLKRKMADFENFRKRQEREKAEFQSYANSQLILDLLPFLDNLERALDHANHAADAGFVEGVRLIVRQVKDVLARYGVTLIDSVGTPFDPNFHQAIGFMETEAVPDGAVAEEVAKGYRIRDRLLRPAVVRVARSGASAESQAPAESGEARSRED